ncbi:MAG TPA: DsbA family protein, partial [Candidatus Binataceae bacterium]|nr:DsbA family protein [Candidatus Binataceae bacterium]
RWINSEAALMGSELARGAGVFDQFHDSVFQSGFEQRLDISDPDLLTELAIASGIDGETFRHAIRMRLAAPQLAANKNEADQFSAVGYPTFMLGEFPLIGIQPIETMRLLLSRFLSQRRAVAQ